MDSISEKGKFNVAFFLLRNFPPKKVTKLHISKFQRMRKSGYFPLANQINWSSQPITSWKWIFCVFLFVSSSHLEWRNILNRSPPESGFLCISLSSPPSGGRFSKIEALNQLGIVDVNFLCFFQCFLIFLGRIFTMFIIFIAAALAKQKNWNY